MKPRPTPFYTRGFILHTDNPVTELVERAYAHKNAAQYLLVKGAVDYVMNPQGSCSGWKARPTRPWRPSAARGTP